MHDGEQQADEAPVGMADDVRRRQLEPLHERVEIGDVLGHRIVVAARDRLVWPVVTAAVGDDMEAAAERRQLAIPGTAIARRPMHEHERFAAAPLDVVEPCAVDVDRWHRSPPHL
jgi:hypothetical protein